MDAEEFQTPGELIQDLLKARNWSQRTLSVILEIGEGTITRLIAGRQPVRAEFAVVLEDVFGVPAERFLHLQNKLDLVSAKNRMPADPDRVTRARLHGDLPIGEMIKRGWLGAHDIRETKKVEAELMRFFGVTRREEIEVLPGARQEGAAPDATPAQLAWLRRVRQIACGLPVATYSADAAYAAIAELRASLSSLDGVAHVPRLLAACGIRFVIVEALAATNIDGACLWLDDRAPVIGLSLRNDRIGNFWFVLRHELEHVLQRHGRKGGLLDIDLEGARTGVGDDISDEDRIANTAAHDFFASTAALDDFVARNVPSICEAELIGFARTLQIHPGILAGLIQARTGRYSNRHSRFRPHLVAVRAVVAANAVTDGWGRPAPAKTPRRGSHEQASSDNFIFIN